MQNVQQQTELEELELKDFPFHPQRLQYLTRDPVRLNKTEFAQLVQSHRFDVDTNSFRVHQVKAKFKKL